MAGYIEKQLTTGERTVYSARKHWLAVIIDGRRAWASLIVAIAALVIWTQVDGTLANGNLRTIVGYIAVALLVVSLLWLGVRIWDWRNEEYVVTNRRVIKLEGILNKRSMDSSLEKINDAVVDQNFVGRIFGYADLDILTAAEGSFDKFRMLARATDFHKALLEQKHSLEIEVARGGTAPIAAPASEDITKTLDNLAGLRDRGAITVEEYEAKKKDLLGRL